MQMERGFGIVHGLRSGAFDAHLIGKPELRGDR